MPALPVERMRGATSPDGPAEARVLRLVAVGFVPATAAFGLLVAPSIAEQMRDFPFGWCVAVLAGVLLSALVMGLIAFVAPLGVIRTLAAVSALATVLALATEPLVAHLPGTWTSPWIQQITAIGAIAGVIAWRTSIAIAGAVVVAALTFLDRAAVGGTAATVAAMQDAAYVLLFCLTFVALGANALAGARAVDDAERHALRDAAAEATESAREREQARVNALVHDRVLATLLTAASPDPEAAALAAADAERALTDLHGLLSDQDQRAAPSGEELVWLLQATTTELMPDAVFGYELGSVSGVEAATAEALLAAFEEALRNSLRHAGEANRAVHVVVAADHIAVDVLDDGSGFDPDAVPPGRLGIVESIRGRMAAVDGGRADIVTAAGVGTRVRLRIALDPV